MTVQRIKQKYPAVFQDIFSRGIKAEKRRMHKAQIQEEVSEWIASTVRCADRF